MNVRTVRAWLLALLAVISCSTAEEFDPWEDIEARTEHLFTAGDISDPRAGFSDIEETEVAVNPQAAGYELPLDLSLVSNLERDVRNKGIHPIQGDAAEKLAENGFVIVPTGQAKLDRFSSAYQRLSQGGGQERVPVFVTSDSVLHLYHLFFGQILKYLEATEFRTALADLLEMLVRSSIAQYQGFDGELKEAARRNVAFLSVALQLLHPDLREFSDVPEAEQELALIDAHDQLAASPLMNHDCPPGCEPCGTMPEDVACQSQGACTCEDYTQYVPRGHYTVSEGLKRYFKAMMWLGRIGFRVRSHMETVQSVLLTDALNAAEVEGVSAAEIWHRIYDVTGFLVGAADDLTFYEYQEAVANAFGNGFDMAELSSTQNLEALQRELDELRAPRILGGFSSAFLHETETTKGFRFMGQRFAPDSYVLGQTVWDHIGPDLDDPRIVPLLQGCGAPDATCSQVLGDLELSNCICFDALTSAMPELCRFMPKGLDVMAVLGSGQASRYLEPDGRYCGFEQAIEDLRTEFAAYGREDWHQNVYWYWLDVLAPLHEEPAEGYPNWMRTDAWATKALNAQLTSWAQLRHDTILYVKQSYTPATGGTAAPFAPETYGTVEPVPAFFARLGDLAAYSRDGLVRHQAMPPGLQTEMDRMIGLLRDLSAIAVSELEGRELSQPQIDTITHMGDTFESIVEALAEAVTVEAEGDAICEEDPESCYRRTTLEGDDPYKTTIVADVHTDVNTESALEEGSGYLDWLIVCRQLPDGTLGVSVGPVFSYYEFAQPMRDRLTDEAWKQKLESSPPSPRDWIQRIRAQ